MQATTTLSSMLGALALVLTTSVARAAPADPTEAELDPPAAPGREPTFQLSGFTSAGYLTAGGASGGGGALATGVRLGVGPRFALGFDVGYGLMATPHGSAFRGTTMEDRWWLIPSMAFVIPARVADRRAAFDLGFGFGLGTASGYRGWADYSAHPFTADWEFQLEPTFRAHAIGSLEVSPSLDVFVRADAAALILPHGSGPSVTDSTWLMLSLGTRFRLL